MTPTNRLYSFLYSNGWRLSKSANPDQQLYKKKFNADIIVEGDDITVSGEDGDYGEIKMHEKIDYTLLGYFLQHGYLVEWVMNR